MFKNVKTLGPGESFGEQALLRNQDRAATIVCTSTCRFATLTRKDYYLSLANIKKREMRFVVTFFRNFRIFEGLRNSVIEKIAMNMEKTQFMHG